MALTYNCKAELSITDFKNDKEEQIANHFNAIPIHDTILKKEIIVKEEPTYIKYSDKYGNEQHTSDAFNILKEKLAKEEPTQITSYNKYEQYRNHGEQGFEAPDSNKLEFGKDPNLSKLSPTREFISTDLCKSMTTNVDGSEYHLVDEQENPEDNRFNKGVEIKNENQDYSECSDDFSTNYAGMETKTPKTEDDIDIIYEDVKPEIFGKKSGGKSNHNFYLNCTDDVLMGTIEMKPSSPHELSLVTDIREMLTNMLFFLLYIYKIQNNTTVRLVGMSDHYTNDTLQNLILKCNKDMFSENSDCKVVKIMSTKKNDKIFQVII